MKNLVDRVQKQATGTSRRGGDGLRGGFPRTLFGAKAPRRYRVAGISIPGLGVDVQAGLAGVFLFWPRIPLLYVRCGWSLVLQAVPGATARKIAVWVPAASEWQPLPQDGILLPASGVVVGMFHPEQVIAQTALFDYEALTKGRLAALLSSLSEQLSISDEELEDVVAAERAG